MPRIPPLSPLLFLLSLSCGCLSAQLRAVDADRPADVEAMLARGDYPRQSGPYGDGRSAESALFYAVCRNRPAVVEALLKHGTSPNSRLRTLDAGGTRWVWDDPQTPLHVAAMHGRTDIARILLRYGADAKALTAVGTPALVARKFEHPGFAKLMEGSEADAPLRALKLAREKRRRDAAAALPGKLAAIEAAERTGDEALSTGKTAEAFASYRRALSETPPDAEPEIPLRRKLVEAARTAAPAVPEDARLRSERAQVFLKKAEGPEGYALAEEELRQALRLAPWWGEAYFNLGLVQERIGDVAGAMTSFRLYLAAAPEAADAERVRKKLVELQVAQELEERKAPEALP